MATADPFAQDAYGVRLAVQLDATDRVPELRDGVFVAEDQAAA